MAETWDGGSESEDREGRRTHGNGAQDGNGEGHAISDNSEHLRFAVADLETNSDFGFFQPSRGSGVPASWPATALRSSAWWNRIQQIAGAATASLFAGFAPALAMAALWHTAEAAPLAFVFTFAIALAHAIFLALPLFIALRAKRWINVITCVVFGFAVCAVPY